MRAYAEQLLKNETVVFRPRGGSMTPHIRSGQQVTVEPVGEREIAVGDIVLCKVSGHYYLHFVKAVAKASHGKRYQIGNAHGRINGWTQAVFGVCTRVEP